MSPMDDVLHLFSDPLSPWVPFPLSLASPLYLMKLINFSVQKSLLCKKARVFQTHLWKRCCLWSRYGAGTWTGAGTGTGTVTGQKSEPEPLLVKSRNFLVIPVISAFPSFLWVIPVIQYSIHIIGAASRFEARCLFIRSSPNTVIMLSQAEKRKYCRFFSRWQPIIK